MFNFDILGPMTGPMESTRMSTPLSRSFMSSNLSTDDRSNSRLDDHQISNISHNMMKAKQNVTNTAESMLQTATQVFK